MNNFGGEIITGAGMTAGGPIANGPDGSPVSGAKAFRFCDPGTDPNEVGSSWIGQYVGQILATRDGLLGWVWNGESWTEFSSNPTAIVKAGQSLAEGPDGLPPAGTKIFRFIDNDKTPATAGVVGTYRGQIVATRNGGIAWEWDGVGWMLWDRQQHIRAGQYIADDGPDGDPPAGAQAFRFINAGLDPNTEMIVGQYVGQTIATRDGISGWWWNGFTWTAYSPIPTSSIKAGQLIETGPDGSPPEDARAFRFIDAGQNPTTLAEVGRYVGQLISTRDGLSTWEWNGSAWVTWTRTQTNRVLVYEVDFSTLPDQNLVGVASPIIDGITYKSVLSNYLASFGIVNGQGLVARSNIMYMYAVIASSQLGPFFSSLLAPGATGSIGDVFPLARPNNRLVRKTHFVAVFSAFGDVTTVKTHGAYFGVIHNETPTSIAIPDAYAANCFQSRLGYFEAGFGGVAGLQSGHAHHFISGTDGPGGLGADGHPLATDTSQLVQCLSIGEGIKSLATAPASAAPTIGVQPNWQALNHLFTCVTWERLSPNRAYLPHLFIAPASNQFTNNGILYTLKSLHIYADLA